MTEPLIVRNEFAQVSIEVDTEGLAPRLKITDLRTKQAAYLDALELESLAWSTHGDLRQLLDPSFRRWKQAEDEEIPSRHTSNGARGSEGS